MKAEVIRHVVLGFAVAVATSATLPCWGAADAALEIGWGEVDITPPPTKRIPLCGQYYQRLADTNAPYHSRLKFVAAALKKGSKGEDVYWLQMKLKELGYYTGTVTGGFYSGTESAVKAFQRANGMYASGKADKAMLEVLYADVLSTPEPQPTPEPTPALTPSPTPAP